MQQYNDPYGGTESTIEGAGSSQMNTFYWQRRALVEAQKEMFFMPLADVKEMPKHYGKTIKVFHYIPLLDDRNVNDQGIDASGVTLDKTTFTVIFPRLVLDVANAAAAGAVTTIETDTLGITATAGAADSAGTGRATITLSDTVGRYSAANKDAVEALNVGAISQANYGALYGSSRDVGLIDGRLPTLSENGGRVNRVGFTRIQRVGQMQKFGFFHEFTQESLDFDSDADLYQHLSRESVTGATQLTEAVLQKELLAGAGVVVYTGDATSDATIDGESADPGEVSYEDLMSLSRILTDNRTPMQTTVIAGSRMIDTKTIGAGRVLYIGSALERTVKGMTDLFNDQAFVPVHKYADGGTVLNGEIGTIDHFRIVVVPEMLHWSGAGALVGTNPGFEEAGGRYNVYPMLCVGADSFTTIGFQYSGKSMKFKIITKMPGKATADRTDPYGEMGFSSIKWWHGTMILRPERLGLVKTLARI